MPRHGRLTRRQLLQGAAALAAIGPAVVSPSAFGAGDRPAPVEVGHRSATVCHLGNVAMMLGRRVNWDPVAERFVNDPEADRMLSRAMRAPWHL